MAKVRLDAVRKVYDNGHVGVAGASFEVAHGERLVLVGPSGCGKSTLLRMIAGLESISSGTLSIGDRVVNDVSPRDRDIAMVFQNYALYPHMSVADNLGFALKLRGTPAAEVAARVREAASMLELDAVLDRRPAQLSGGQRQRVALGRALVRKPAVFLLDEPLSNLDAKLRATTRVEIARLHRRLATTMIYVTHDQVEAMTLGDRIVVLDRGEIQQIDTPMALYERPATLFVAAFLGSPAMNLLRGKVVRDDGLRLDCGSASLPLPHRTGPDFSARLGEDIVVGIRPEDLHRSADGADAAVRAVLELAEPVGSEVYFNLRFGERGIVARMPPSASATPGASIAFDYDARRLHAFDPQSGRRLDLPELP